MEAEARAFDFQERLDRARQIRHDLQANLKLARDVGGLLVYLTRR